ncbi:MAG: hypothetical protein JHD35_07835 [Sphingopyxis sp.]|nr:hypothetical protein [Sphingopyxis sp.]
MDNQFETLGALRVVRDRLREQLAILDRHGEVTAAIELNSAIELLNARVGEPTSDEETMRLQHDYFAN